MDIKQIETKYNSELAVLKSKKADLSKKLTKAKAALELTDEEFTKENIEVLLKDNQVIIEGTTTKLEGLISEYESTKEVKEV